jgi:hypothetical protein
VTQGALGPESAEIEIASPLAARAATYERAALLVALERKGYGLDDIRFDSRDPEEVGAELGAGRIRLGPRGSLVRGLLVEPRRGVTVYLNVGLFSAVSPLPSYFHHLLAEPHVGERLTTVLRVLDHGLLRAHAAAERLVPLRSSDWERNLTDALVTGSPLYVEGLFRRVFPELRVRVAWRKVRRTLRIDRLALGSATLGKCAFDGYGVFPRQGLEVTLTVPRGEPELVSGPAPGDGGAFAQRTWAQEAKRRLDAYVLPRFSRHPAAFLVRLQVLSSREEARLASARVGEDALPSAPRPFTVVLFEGASARLGQDA